MSNDPEKLIAWLHEGARELETAHAYLDAEGVPRDNPESGNPFTLAARIAYHDGAR